MDNLLQTANLSPEIHELLQAIEDQHRLMLEMQANLQRLEEDLALARQVRDDHTQIKHCEHRPTPGH
jgi:hypothetical protein